MNNKTLKRMLELANIKKPLTENKINLSSIQLVKKASDNKVYAIVRENSKYFIKTTDKKQNLTESDFDYLGGLGNKPKYSYNSYEDATKNLNLFFDELNRVHGGTRSNILESDTHLLGEKKYVIKMDKPKSDGGGFGSDGVGSDEGGFDFGSDKGNSDEESGDEGGFDFGSDEESSDEGGFGSDGESDDEDLDLEDDESDDEDLEDDEDLDLEDDEVDPIKSIQKMTGKLGQKLRDTEDISSDMQKWVAKSVLSALDLGEMDNSDKKDLIRTIKSKKSEENDFGSDEEESDNVEGFDFGSEEKEVEESYSSFMTDNSDDFDGMPDLNKTESYDSYSSYMEDETYGMENNFMYGPENSSDDWYREMSDEGLLNTDTYSPNVDEDRGGERYDRDELLFDGYDSYMEDEAIIDPITQRNTKNLGNLKSPNSRNSRIDDLNNNKYNLGMRNFDPMMFPAPAPTTKPGKPETKPDTTPGKPTERPGRPSTRPFDPPPYIEPGQEPDPKARHRSRMRNFDPTMSPAPAPAPTTKPGKPETKPGTPDKTPGKDRPSRRPFDPPPHITPGEEPGPKAGYDDDVEFEY